MSYRGIDCKRYEYLLRNGTQWFEISRFFKERRQSLILKGPRVQNLPPDPARRLKCMMNGLPLACDEVVRSWFAQHLAVNDPADAVVVRAIYEYMERTDQLLKGDLATRTARSCLHHLFSEEPPEELLAFLRSPIPGSTARVPGAVRAQTSEPAAAELDRRFLVELCQSLIAGNPPLEQLDGLPADLAAFAAGMSACRRGDEEAVARARDTLASHGDLAQRLTDFEAAETERRAARADDAPGLRLLGWLPYAGGFDIDRDQVLACCTRADRPNTVFLRPFGLLIEGHLQLLDDAARRALFPVSGDLIAFPGTHYPAQPRAGDFGACRAAEIDSHKEFTTRFRIASALGPSWKVHNVPVASTDHDAVREHIVAYGERVTEPQRVLFALADGIIVGQRGNPVDYSRPELFEDSLCLWNSLDAVRFEGQTYVLGQLPKEHGNYECAPIETMVRKHLRSLMGTEKSPVRLTKAQLQDLVQALPESTIKREERDLKRVRVALTRLGAHRELLDEFVKEVNCQKEIRAEVDRRVETEVARRIGEKKQAQEEIDRLRAEAGTLEARLRKERAQQKRLPEELAKSVRAAFERAAANGVETLGEIPLWHALLSAAAPAAAPPDRDPRPALPRPQVHVLDPSGNELLAVFKSLGLPRRRAEALLGAGAAVFEAGLILCVKGTAARILLREWARTLGERPVAFDAIVGLIDDAELRDVLASNPDTLVLLDGNLSALDLYGRVLLDQAMVHIGCGRAKARPRVLCALSDSVAALPLGSRVASISVTVGLDQPYHVLRPDEVAYRLEDLSDPEGEERSGRLWAPAYDSLLGQLRLLDDERKALVLPLLLPKR